MTEQEWLDSDSPSRMVRFLMGRHRRKMRLFGCACCRQVWEQMTDPRSRRAVDVAERLADDQASVEEVEEARAQAHQAVEAASRAGIYEFRGSQVTLKELLAHGWLPYDGSTAARFAVIVLAPADFFWRATIEGLYSPGVQKYPVYYRRCCSQAEALRCLFGNPFHPVAINPGWLSCNEGTVRRLAEAIYDDRAFDRLPVLADALEEAGCADAALLAHCRGPGPHVRGCWAVDLLLGKE